MSVMGNIKRIVGLILLGSVFRCVQFKGKIIVVKNNLNIERISETVVIPLAKEHQPGGTLASVVDCWFKRVSYPIINKWYKKNTDGTRSYHVD